MSNPGETGTITYHFLSIAAHYFHTTDNWQGDVRHLLSKLKLLSGACKTFILQGDPIQSSETFRFTNYWYNSDDSVEATPFNLSQISDSGKWISLLSEGKPIHWTTTGTESFWHDELEQFGLKAFAAFPILVHDKLWGLITLEFNRTMRTLSEQEISILEGVAGLLGRAIEKEELHRELKTDKLYYEELFHSSPAAIVVLDRNGTVERVNREFTNLFQYKPEEIIGKVIDDVLPGKYDQEKARSLTNRILEGERVTAEGLRYRKDGSPIHVSIVGVKSLPDSEEITLYSIYHDVTERVVAQESLRESQSRLELLFESANDAIFLLKEGFVVDCNARTLTIFRCTKEQIIGKSAIELSSFRQPNGIRSLRLAVEYFKAAMGHEQKSFEWLHMRPDGSLFNAEVSINVFEWKGETFTQAIVRDISKRKLTEKLLLQRYDFIAFLSRISADLINLDTVHIDATINEIISYSGSFTGCTKAFIYLLNAEGVQLQLSHRWDINSVSSNPTVQFQISVLPDIFDRLARGEAITREVVMTSGIIEDIVTSELFDLSGYRSFTLLPLTVAGKFIGLTGYFTELGVSVWNDDLLTPLKLTNQMIANAIERRRVEQELKSAKEKAVESDKLKTAFLSSMSHEIRTPMNHILGFIDLLKDPSLSDTEKKEFMAIVKSSGNLLLKLIDDIIDIAKLESGQLVINDVDVQLNKFIDDIKFIFNEQLKNIGKDKLEFIIQKPVYSMVDTIKADPIRLQQIVTNLLSNALKFTQEGRITFGYSLEPDHKLHFFVEDTGIGIPPEKHAEVFERFRQLDGSYAREYSGTGLGLAISKGLVELMNGVIGVESQLGKGSRFFFTIPYTPVRSHTEPVIVKHTVASEFNFTGKTILVVEDDEINYRFLEIVIMRTKATVIRAFTGKEAIDIALNQDIHLVLMDIQIPVVDGYVATVEIKKVKPRLPVIAQTAHALAEERERCLQSGADDYLAKPISRKDLLVKMSNHIMKTRN